MKHPHRTGFLTAFGTTARPHPICFADVPLLCKEKGEEGEVCHPQFVMLSGAKHSHRTGFLTAFGTTARPHPVCFADVPLLCKERNKEGEVSFHAKHPTPPTPDTPFSLTLQPQTASANTTPSPASLTSTASLHHNSLI